MIKTYKIFISLFMAVIISLSPIPISYFNNESKNVLASQIGLSNTFYVSNVGESLNGIMEFITSEYIDSTITYKKLFNSSNIGLLEYAKKNNLKGVTQRFLDDCKSKAIARKYHKNENEIYGYALAETFYQILEIDEKNIDQFDQIYDSAMKGMFNELDEYSEYLTIEENKEFISYLDPSMLGIGISYNFNDKKQLVIKEVFENNPASNAGVLEGDIILKINGVAVSDKKIDDIRQMFIEAKEDIVKIEINRNNNPISFTIIKEKIVLPTTNIYKLSDYNKELVSKTQRETRLLNIPNISNNVAKEVEDNLTKMKKDKVNNIIIDLRDNTGGYLDQALDICSLIVPKGIVMSINDNANGKIDYLSELEKSPFDKIIVLTGPNTASAAEVIASALQDANAATIIGETTYGKGLIQTKYDFASGAAIKFTVEEYYRRNGGKINKIGVTPNIIVELNKYIEKPIVVELGKKNKELINVKKILTTLGYKFTNYSDLFDKETKSNLIAFQKNQQIKQNGELDLKTVEKLNELMADYYRKNDIVLDRAIAELELILTQE